jgi:hypothetical protein
VDPDGRVHVAAEDMHFPNGCVITPDGATLIVAETLAMRLTAFDIGPDGSLANRRVWAPLGMRAPDGVCLDANGHVWVANAIARECVLVAPGGKSSRRADRAAVLRLHARRRGSPDAVHDDCADVDGGRGVDRAAGPHRMGGGGDCRGRVALSS